MADRAIRDTPPAGVKAGDSSFHLSHLSFEFRNDGARLFGAACSSRYGSNIRANIRERMRIERDDLCLARQMRESRAQIVGRAAQTWQRSCVMIRSGSIRTQCGQIPHCRDFHHGRGIADLAVNGCGALRVRNARHDQDWFGPRPLAGNRTRADSGDLIAQSQRE